MDDDEVLLEEQWNLGSHDDEVAESVLLKCLLSESSAMENHNQRIASWKIDYLQKCLSSINDPSVRILIIMCFANMKKTCMNTRKN